MVFNATFNNTDTDILFTNHCPLLSRIIYHYEEREATPPFNKVYLFSNNLTNNFATDDDIISLSSVISNQINFSSLLKNWKFGYLSVIKLR